MRRRDEAQVPWAVSLGIVVAVYAALIGGVLWWHARAPAPAIALPPEAIAIELAPTAEAPPAAATEIPPGPAQQEQHRPQPTPTPPPRLVLPSDPEAALSQAPQPQKPREREDLSDQAEVDQTLAPPDVQAQASQRYAGQQTVSGQRTSAQVTWQGLLLGHLEQHRRYPRQAERLRQQGVAYVRFSVDRQGHASNIRLGTSSGHALLDAETLDTVRRGNPVPPPPADLPGDPVEVMVPVAFSLRGR
jgi:protein TonB